MLEVRALDVAHGDTQVVHGVDLDVAAGEAVAIIGSNGAGKTTTLKAICGWLPARAGTVRFDGRTVTGTPTQTLKRAGMAYVPAERHLFPTMSVTENLQLGAYPAKPARAQRDVVFELFPRLADRGTQLAGTMSGGEQQMLAVGRALMSRPRLLMLDEPTTGLAPILAEEAYRALARLREDGEITVVVAEQQVPLVFGFADRAYVLEDGRVQLEGPCDALADDPAVRRAYLGIDR
ncbi:MAG: ABC transporter ATP-binding protein [Nitriliruptoraceae bacterium]|nr:ABC transporter ATP-binding protein [Nitriliruptoraceae bacterium]